MDRQRLRGFLCTLVLFVRPFAWMVCCVVAVAIHHTWFGIGKRGTVLAFSDGVVLVFLYIGMAWAYRKIMRPDV